MFDKLVWGLVVFEWELKKFGEEFIWDDYIGYIVLDLIYFGIVFEVRVCVKLYYLFMVS